MTQKKKVTERKTTRKATPKKTATVDVQSVEEILKVDEVEEVETDEPKLFAGREMYWKNPVHIGDRGVVTGIVYEDDWNTFMAKAPKDLDPFNWVASSDLVAKRLEDAKAKMKDLS